MTRPADVRRPATVGFVKERARFGGALGGQHVERAEKFRRRLVLAGQEEGLGAQQRQRVIRGEARGIVGRHGRGPRRGRRA